MTSDSLIVKSEFIAMIITMRILEYFKLIIITTLLSLSVAEASDDLVLLKYFRLTNISLGASELISGMTSFGNPDLSILTPITSKSSLGLGLDAIISISPGSLSLWSYRFIYRYNFKEHLIQTPLRGEGVAIYKKPKSNYYVGGTFRSFHYSLADLNEASEEDPDSTVDNQQEPNGTFFNINASFGYEFSKNMKYVMNVELEQTLVTLTLTDKRSTNTTTILAFGVGF